MAASWVLVPILCHSCPAGESWSGCLAESTDFVSWKKKGVVISPEADLSSFDSGGLGLASIAFISGDVWMPVFGIEKQAQVSRCMDLDTTTALLSDLLVRLTQGLALRSPQDATRYVNLAALKSDAIYW